MNALLSLRQDAFLRAASTVSSGEGLRAFLRRRPEVVALRKQLISGQLSPSDISGFVGELLCDLERGKKFAEEVILAAIAVAIETLPGDFASSYLADLANLHIREIPLAPRVAASALARRRSIVIETTERTRKFAVPDSVASEFRPAFFEAGVSDESIRLAS